MSYKLKQLDSHRPSDCWYRQAVRVLRACDGGEHGLLLYMLARNLDAGCQHVLLDVGTARGFSAMTMARGLLDGGVGGRVYSIDVLEHCKAINWHSATKGKQDDDEPLAKIEISRSDIWARWYPEEAAAVTPITATSHDALDGWNFGPVSLAFLDGSHTYEAVLGDLMRLDSLLSDDGCIVLDDYHVGISVGQIRSYSANLAARQLGRTLGKLWPTAKRLSPGDGSQNEFVLVRQRYYGIRAAVAQFLHERAGKWAFEIVPMPSRGEYQGDDYGLAILSRCASESTSIR